MNPRVAPVAYAAMAIPSSTAWGSWSIRARSLKQPGSPSSALQTTVFVPPPASATAFHFAPVGKPAPPRPASPLSVTRSTTSEGAILVTASSRPSYPAGLAIPPESRAARRANMTKDAFLEAARVVVRQWRRDLPQTPCIRTHEHAVVLNYGYRLVASARTGHRYAVKGIAHLLRSLKHAYRAGAHPIFIQTPGLAG